MLSADVEPSCKAAWTRRLGNIDWRIVGAKFAQRLLTPKDYMTYFKLILHRALLVRNINPDAPTSLCRICERETETISQLATCHKLKPFWHKFARLSCNPCLDSTQNERCILLGLLPDSPMPQALSDFHLILWKFILIHFTLVDLKKQRFIADDVWKGAVRRYASKVNSLSTRLQMQLVLT